jgi:hypothetical protein
LPLVVLGIVALIVVVLLVRAVTRGDDYSPRALTVAQNTVKLGRQVVALRAELKTIDRLTLFRRLRTWERDAKLQLDRARELDPPADRRAINAYLLTSLGLRSDAMRRFGPSVQNALSDRDLQVAASQLLGVTKDLLLSDRSYELFAASWPRSVRPRPGESRWVADPDDATVEGATGFVRELRKQPALAANYNLAIESIGVDPKPAGKEKEIDVVPFTRSLSVSVVVTNNGNQAVPAVPVAVVLTSETDPEPSTVEGNLGPLRPGEKKSVVLKGLEPAGGAVNLLRVTVGPAGGERNTLDNVVEYKFSMRRP